MISQADLIITSFGMTFFESLILKKPVLLINPSQYHDKLTKDFEYPYFIENNDNGIIFGLDVKIKELLELDTPSYIVNGLKTERLEKLMLGEKAECTEIRK